MNSEKIINCQNVWKLYGHNPEKFINSKEELMRKIKNIDNTDEKNLGSFNVYLKSKNKFR